ncbi:cytochrome P450 [Biscogniauxia mediterranea]|nr:cytochrome P450 [Biscogniauxia mediterranea]
MLLPKAIQNWLSSSPISQDITQSRLVYGDFQGQSTKILLSFLILFATYYVIPVLYDLLFSPLRKIPGPIWARFTRWWEYRLVAKGDSNLQYIHLHKRYGPVVRVGPNRYSITRPEDVKVVYDIGSKFTKSDYYKPLLHPDPDEQSIFAIQDNNFHKERRRKISALYSMSTMVSYEEAVERMTSVCLRKLNQFSEEKRLVSIPHFMQCYAFDVIGEITFNQNFGMMENEGDTTGLLSSIKEVNDSLAYLGVIPNLIPWVYGLRSALRKKQNAQRISENITTEIDKYREANKGPAKGKKYETFLTKVLNMEAEGRIGESNMRDVCGSNIGAGSDTTAVTMSAALYYLFTNPEKLDNLRQEIDVSAKEGRVSDPIRFQEAQSLPYLQAVIKETLRMHPAVGSMLPRKVPKGGMHIAGYYFPEGTEIGANPWALHYSDDIYGPDPQSFRPERWLGSAKTSVMESMMFAFGAGSRTCIGKNISLLEMAKALPQIIRKFDMVLEHPDRPMSTNCAWFVYTDFNGWFKVRASGE